MNVSGLGRSQSLPSPCVGVLRQISDFHPLTRRNAELSVLVLDLVGL